VPIAIAEIVCLIDLLVQHIRYLKLGIRTQFHLVDRKLYEESQTSQILLFSHNKVITKLHNYDRNVPALSLPTQTTLHLAI